MNIDLFQLFTEGEYYLLAGNCAAVVPIKDKIMQSPSRLPPNRCPRCTRVGCWTHRVCVFLARAWCEPGSAGVGRAVCVVSVV